MLFVANLRYLHGVVLYPLFPEACSVSIAELDAIAHEKQVEKETTEFARDKATLGNNN
jgi:hypothetical protein